MIFAQNMKDKSSNTKYWQKLLQKYRLVISAENSFEERLSLRASIFNLLSFLLFTICFVIILTLIIITQTSLNEYIPGRSKKEVQKDLVALYMQVDSLEAYIIKRDLYLENIAAVLSGKDTFLLNHTNRETTEEIDLEEVLFNTSIEDSLLRIVVETEEKGSIRQNTKTKNSHFVFFPPVEGMISDTFNFEKKHFAIDLVAKKNSTVSSVLDGTVVVSHWSVETGFVIGVQHKNNYLSFYKHNSVLLKKAGDFVSAGEHIAIIGNSGELSSGPHLHFELWHDGVPVNPLNYIKF